MAQAIAISPELIFSEKKFDKMLFRKTGSYAVCIFLLINIKILENVILTKTMYIFLYNIHNRFVTNVT